MRTAINLAESGLIPDELLRWGIRRLLKQRLTQIGQFDASSMEAELARELRRAPLAIATDFANSQHYGVTPEFFLRVLGPRLKYSSCYYPTLNSTLAEAEEEMLRLTCERAELTDGMSVLELGCGWGSLSLWLAESFPNCHITALSNSCSQREFIEACADARGLENLEVITADICDFHTNKTFDRIVSVEMFEHMRNYEELFKRISGWLVPDGKLFAHVFCHLSTPYLFETEGAGNWMGRNFFTGGTMPSENLFRQFSRDLSVQRQWRVDGLHYWRTCEDWLQNLDRNRKWLLDCFGENTSRKEAKRYLQRWRMFFLACAELFRFNEGREWFVGHYLFEHTTESPPREAMVTSGSELAN